MFISVDFPAPFSPSSVCTSPRRMSRLTSSLARTPGNSLRTPRISSTSSSVTAARFSWSGLGRAGTWPALPGAPLRSLLLGECRRNLQLPGDDLLPVAVHQRDSRLRDGRIDPAHAEAVVLQVQEQVLAALELAGR